MTTENTLPEVFAITEQEIDAVLATLGEMKARESFKTMQMLIAIGSDARRLPEDLVASMVPAPMPDEEDAEEVAEEKVKPAPKKASKSKAKKAE